MMKRIALYFCIFLFIHQLNAQKEITVDKIWTYRIYASQSPRGLNFIPHTNHYTEIIDNVILVYDISSDKLIDTLYNGNKSKVRIGRFEIYGGDNLLLYSDIERIYRRSSRGVYHFYNAAQDKTYTIAQGNNIMHASPDPEFQRIAYVNENNIYIQDLGSGKIKQLTHDGEKNKIINGDSDWVYEEEFSLVQAFEWSPDGKYIAYLKFDESKIPLYELSFYRGEDYPDIYKYKYPKVGAPNSIVTLHIYNTLTHETQDVKLVDTYYIPRLKWSPAGNLILTTMNRHQNVLNLLKVNPGSEKIDTILHEESDTYIGLHDVYDYINEGGQFIWMSERNQYKQLFLFNADGELVKVLTPVGSTVTDYYGYDKSRNEVVYQVAMDPLNREIRAVNVKTGKPRVLEKQIGINSAHFSPTYDFYVHTFSTINTPPIYTLKNNMGKVIQAMEDNSSLRKKQAAYGLSQIEFFKIKSAGEDSLNGWMIKPADFDPSKEYPLFMYVYGGPGAQTVRNSWMGYNYWWFQMLAQKGIIIVSVDNRGTGARGSAFKKQTYLNLGKLEVKDQIAVAQQLAARDFIDEDRVGIFGWSYGGFMASNCIFKGNEVFTLAIAVAPVTHWKWYDTIYTERYMRTYKENPEGYDENSPINFVDGLKGDFLLVHGLADDNVHFQNTAELVKALIKAGKQYEFHVYPNRNHGIYGNNARTHLYTKMTTFVLSNYGLK